MFAIFISILNYFQSRFYGVKLNNFSEIRTEDDYKKALKEIEYLWDKAEVGTPAGNRFDYLATIIDDYERVNFPILPPKE